MKKSTQFYLRLILLCCCLLMLNSFTGCTDILTIDSTIRYQKQPTRIQYDIMYGYTINCSGSGTYEIIYKGDLPTVSCGSILSVRPLYPDSYEEVRFGDNILYVWNISGTIDAMYTLGFSASVQSEIFYIDTLHGDTAFSCEYIATQYPDLISRYCQQQSHEGVVYIDPLHEDIAALATSIYQQENTDNALLLAKALFSWLKENTRYQIHQEHTPVQPSIQTFTSLAGDCDDLAFLYIALCRSLGIPARFVRGYLITTAENMPSIGPHAWAEVFVGGNLGNGGWIPVECASTSSSEANIHQNFGVEDVSHLRLFIDAGNNDSLVRSLSSISWSYMQGMQIAAESFVRVTNYTILEEKQLVISADGHRSYVR